MIYPISAFLETSSTGGGWITILMLVVLIGFFYFFIMRPQKKQEREIKDMRDNLVVGDEITTIGGIIGKIISIKDETCMIETGKDKTRMRILKSAVRCVDVPDEAARAAAAAQKAAEEEKAAAERAAKEAELAAKRAEEGKKGKRKKKEALAAPAETPDAAKTPADAPAEKEGGETSVEAEKENPASSSDSDN